MINLPDGFDATAFMGEFFSIAAPFVGISFLVACGFLISNYLNSIDFH